VGVSEQDAGPKRQEVRGGWRKVHYGNINLYSSPNIIVINSRMGWAGPCCMHGRKYKILIRKLASVADQGIDWRLTLKWILNRL
jgi:hypothetical protein